MIKFITGNKGKMEEVKSILGNEVEQLDINLPEIQSVDSQEIIRNKLMEASKHHDSHFIVEDAALHFTCLKGLPGPMIKWFLDIIGNDGIVDLISRYSDNSAIHKITYGYYAGPDKLEYFEGSTEGKIVPAKGERGFGFDPIFIPDGSDRTYAEMTLEEKNIFNPRKKALLKLKEFLEKSPWTILHFR